MDFSQPGPYSVGVEELALASGSPVLVLFPVDRQSVGADAIPFSYTATDMWGSANELWPLAWDATVPNAWRGVPASAQGPFPLVVFSHGWGNTRFTSALHTSHVASWGYVVAVPQHEVRDAVATLGQSTLPAGDPATVVEAAAVVLSASRGAVGPLTRIIDERRVVVEGYSAGARDAVLAASDVPGSDALVLTTPTPPIPGGVVEEGPRLRFLPSFDYADHLAGLEPPALPSLVVTAAQDYALPTAVSDAAIGWLADPTTHVVLVGAGHVTFMDGCQMFQDGEIPGLDTSGLDPTSDVVVNSMSGCSDGDAPAADVRAAWNHVVVAFLESVVGDDPAVGTASLHPQYLADTFPAVVGSIETSAP